MGTKRLRGPERREQILDVCLDVVTTEGFHTATIDRVARDCGITRTVIYEHFGTLGGMLVALIDREAHRASQSFLDTVAPNGTDVPMSIRATLTKVLEAIDADAKTWRLFLFPAEGGPPELHQRLHEARGVVATYIADMVKHHSRHVEDIELHARLVHAAADEMVRLHLSDPIRFPVSRFADYIDRRSGRGPGATAG